MSLTIIYFGSSGFSAEVLSYLHSQSDLSVELVISQPDKPVGRRQKLSPTPVSQKAIELGLPLERPPSLKKLAPLHRLRAVRADFGVVVAYGQIVPERILQTTYHGFLNGHASDLPVLRGAAPIERAILQGCSQTAMCIMQMTPRLDDGDVLSRETLTIGPEEGFCSLEYRLLQSCKTQMCKTLLEYQDYRAQAEVQDATRATYAHKMTLEDSFLDPQQPLLQALACVRALEASSGACLRLVDGRRLRIFKAGPGLEHRMQHPGEVLATRKSMQIRFADGTMEVFELQLEGKKRMSIQAFLNGSVLQSGDVLQRGL